jgi:hypothetical protein
MMKVALCALAGLFLSLPVLSSAQEPKTNPEIKTVEIRAKVQYVGNSYSRLPDGKIIGTLRFYEYEGCYIVMKNRTFNLVFVPAMELVDQQALGGRTMILTGTWGKDTFTVTGYRAAPAGK